MYHMRTGVAFTACVIKCIVAFIFFSFRITRTSVNTDVLGQSPEVRANKVLLY